MISIRFISADVQGARGSTTRLRLAIQLYGIFQAIKKLQ